jgi:hypothetical protein
VRDHQNVSIRIGDTELAPRSPEGELNLADVYVTL